MAIKGWHCMAGWSVAYEVTWQESSAHRGVSAKLSDPPGPIPRIQRILTKDVCAHACAHARTHAHTLRAGKAERETCRQGDTGELSHSQAQGDRSLSCRLSGASQLCSSRPSYPSHLLHATRHGLRHFLQGLKVIFLKCLASPSI